MKALIFLTFVDRLFSVSVNIRVYRLWITCAYIPDSSGSAL